MEYFFKRKTHPWLTELFYTSTFIRIFPSSSLNFILKKKITSRNSNCSKSSSSIGSGVRPSNFPSANCPDRSEATKQLERFSSSLSLDLKDGVERKKRGRKRKSGKKRREKRWRRVLIKRGIGFTLDTKKLGRVRSFSI